MGLFKNLFSKSDNVKKPISQGEQINYPNAPAPATATAVKVPKQERPAAPAAPVAPVLHIPSEICGCTMAYKYENNGIAGVQYANPDYTKIGLCDKIEFILEPDNQYDKNAIKIMDGGICLGHVYKGKMQSMIKDWINKQRYYFSAITNIDKEKNTILYFIAFYKNPLEGIERYEHIDASLTKTSKKDLSDDMSRQEHFDFINEGDVISLEYNDYDEDYLATDECGNELGELNKSVSAKLRSKENLFELVPIVQEITVSDSDKYGAKITIYLKPRTYALSGDEVE